MLILSSAAATSVLASVTSIAGVAGAGFGGLNSTLEAPKSNIQNAGDGDGGEDGGGENEDRRPTGRPERSLAALDIRTQTAAQDAGEGTEAETEDGDSPAVAPEESKTNTSGESVDENGLTDADKRQIEKLKQRDREVKEHERAHSAAGGGIAGQPNYKYATGPDGKQYAVAGEVRINTSPVRGNPEATIRKLEQVKRAALAPREPSGQDRRVAASADAGIAAARREKTEQKREEIQENEEGRAEGETEAANRVSRTEGSGDPVFDPEERFRNEIGGISEPQQTGLAGAGALQTTVGLSDPGRLFSLVA
jgi:hypothetical protein